MEQAAIDKHGKPPGVNAGATQEPEKSRPAGKKKSGASKYDMIKVRVWLEGHHYVLSRYLIARMLTVTRIPHGKATKIALEVKKQLVDAGTLDVQQVDLERCLFGVMEGRGFGAAHVACYRLVSRFMAQKQPLVVLLCGAPWTGKSTIAQQLAGRLNMPNVMRTSLIYDMVKNGGWRSLHPQPLCTRPDLASNQELLSEYQNECVVVQQALEGELNKALSGGKPLILEGSHLDPGLLLEVLGPRGIVLLPAVDVPATISEARDASMPSQHAGSPPPLLSMPDIIAAKFTPSLNPGSDTNTLQTACPPPLQEPGSAASGPGAAGANENASCCLPSPRASTLPSPLSPTQRLRPAMQPIRRAGSLPYLPPSNPYTAGARPNGSCSSSITSTLRLPRSPAGVGGVSARVAPLLSVAASMPQCLPSTRGVGHDTNNSQHCDAVNSCTAGSQDLSNRTSCLGNIVLPLSTESAPTVCQTQEADGRDTAGSHAAVADGQGAESCGPGQRMSSATCEPASTPGLYLDVSDMNRLPALILPVVLHVESETDHALIAADCTMGGSIPSTPTIHTQPRRPSAPEQPPLLFSSPTAGTPLLQPILMPPDTNQPSPGDRIAGDMSQVQGSGHQPAAAATSVHVSSPGQNDMTMQALHFPDHVAPQASIGVQGPGQQQTAPAHAVNGPPVHASTGPVTSSEQLRRARMLQEYLLSYEAQGVPVVRVRYGAFHETVDVLHEYVLEAISTAMASTP